jgi:transposase InsO family protein
MDLFDPIAYISIDGNKYGLVIIDDYSRFTWVFFLQDKSKTQEVLKKFLKRAQNAFDAKVKRIRSDNGTEFKNTQVEDYLDEEGFKHEFSAPYTPQQNGVAKRKNRTLIEMTRTILDEYKTSNRFWAEVVNTSYHATNRLYLHKLLKKTPYELLTCNKPNVSYFRVFGNDEEAPCEALQRMVIGDVRPQDPSEPHAPNDTTPPTQDDEQNQEDELDEDQAHDQEESIDQGGDEDDGDHQGLRTKPPHPRVHQTVQGDHPMDNIPSDIKKGLTTKSHVANFYQHYSFVSSIEPFKIEDALCDPDWVVAMQEELNNLKKPSMILC